MVRQAPTVDTEQSVPRVQRAVLILVALFQTAVGVFLYRMRVVEKWSAGDEIVFGAPPTAAFVVYWLVLFRVSWHADRRRATVAAAGLATIWAACIFFLTMLVNLNLYGG